MLYRGTHEGRKSKGEEADAGGLGGGGGGGGRGRWEQGLNWRGKEEPLTTPGRPGTKCSGRKRRGMQGEGSRTEVRGAGEVGEAVPVRHTVSGIWGLWEWAGGAKRRAQAQEELQG